MENQHRKITGYRDFTEAELAAMNRLKAKAEELRHLLDEIQQIPNVDGRCLAIARTELQTGFMWANRAVARPTTF